MRAIVRKVSSSFENALAKYFGSGPTSLDEALDQHDAYIHKLVEFGVSVKEISSHPDYPDCCFVEDHAIVAGDSVLMTNAGHDNSEFISGNKALGTWFFIFSIISS